jgi:riboflavin biosynthesis pyrimidine reductase
MPTMRFHQLLPPDGDVQIEELIAGLRFAERAPADRPHVVANFVASVDGRATYHGLTGQLGDDGDLEVFRALRREVDAVLVGTGTLRAEQYGRMLKLPESRERLDGPALSFTSALRYLRDHRDVRALLTEGGPSVLAALVREHVLDELFLTLAPQLTGGGVGPALTTGPELSELQPMQLEGVLERAGSLFLRYALEK